MEKQEIKDMIRKNNIELHEGKMLKVPGWVGKSNIEKIKEHKEEIISFLANGGVEEMADDRKKHEMEMRAKREAEEEHRKKFITIQKNENWGWAVFNAPEWMNIRPKWANSDPVTLRDETIRELKLSDADFVAKSENDWPSVEVSVESLKSTTEGKELMAMWSENTEKIESEKKQKENKKAESEQALVELREQKIMEAKETGKEVFIRNVGGYDGDEAHPGQEMGWVQVSEFATPEGKIITKENATY